MSKAKKPKPRAPAKPAFLKRIEEQRKAARVRREEIVTRLNRRNRAS